MPLFGILRGWFNLKHYCQMTKSRTLYCSALSFIRFSRLRDKKHFTYCIGEVNLIFFW